MKRGRRFYRKMKKVFQRIRLFLAVGKRILILNFTGNEANWGCVGTCKGLVKMIRGVWPLARIKKAPIRFYSEGEECPLPPSLDLIDSFLESHINVIPEAKHIEWADYIIFNGEGSVHEWPTGVERPEPQMRLLEVYSANCYFSGKTVLALNQSVEFESSDFAEWVTTCLSPCSYIAVREPRSLRRLQNIGLKNVKLLPDAAFLMDAVPNALA